MKGNSLVVRLVACLFVAQVLAFFIAWMVTVCLGLMGNETFATSLDELATARVQDRVIQSMMRNALGEIEIMPTAELQDEMQRTPKLKFAAFRSWNRAPVAGSSPELLSVLTPMLDIISDHVHFVLPGDPRTVRLGLMDPRSTPFGRFNVAVYGQKFHWTDLLYAARDEMKWLHSYIVAVLVMTTGGAWIAVRWGLKPLRKVAEQAARIDVASLDQRLDADDLSREIRPLVEAVNAALQRLDAGVARQRRFIANAAHELRTPVSVFGARLFAPEEPSFRLDLKRDYRRIRNIIEQLLATSRLGEYRVKLDEKLDLSALARAIVADCALLALRSRREIALEAPAAPVYVRGNGSAIEAVIANLVDNALRAEPEGGTVYLRVTEDASLDVVDHGKGVERGDREAIFEPFWRKDNSVPGTGLGLTIAWEIIDAHRGRICVEETPGGGATFRFWLPRLDQPGCE